MTALTGIRGSAGWPKSSIVTYVQSYNLPAEFTRNGYTSLGEIAQNMEQFAKVISLCKMAAKSEGLSNHPGTSKFRSLFVCFFLSFP